MARAKRTDRAEARRRYRATLAEADDRHRRRGRRGRRRRRRHDGDGEASSSARPRAARRPSPPGPGIATAFRLAFRPLDLRGDLRALPMLLTHPAFLVPTILSGLSVALIPLVGLNALTSTFYQYFSFTAPLGTSFIAGLLRAPRQLPGRRPRRPRSVGFQAIAFSFGSFGGFLDIFTDPATGATMTHDAAAQRSSARRCSSASRRPRSSPPPRPGIAGS